MPWTTSLLFGAADPLRAAAPPPPPAVIVVCVLFGISFALLAYLLGVLGNRRAATVLAAWLAAQHYEVVEQTLAPYPYGPYRMRARWSSKFVIRVKLPSGEAKTGWVCMNNFFLWGFGVPEVQWDP